MRQSGDPDKPQKPLFLFPDVLEPMGQNPALLARKTPLQTSPSQTVVPRGLGARALVSHYPLEGVRVSSGVDDRLAHGTHRNVPIQKQFEMGKESICNQSIPSTPTPLKVRLPWLTESMEHVCGHLLVSSQIQR